MHVNSEIYRSCELVTENRFSLSPFMFWDCGCACATAVVLFDDCRNRLVHAAWFENSNFTSTGTQIVNTSQKPALQDFMAKWREGRKRS